MDADNPPMVLPNGCVYSRRVSIYSFNCFIFQLKRLFSMLGLHALEFRPGRRGGGQPACGSSGRLELEQECSACGFVPRVF